MRYVPVLLSLGLAGCGSDDDGPSGPGGYPLDDVLAVNHVQVKATHNSYHRIEFTDVPALQYEHAPLEIQLSKQGVRAFELDTSWDAAAGEFRVVHIAVIDDLSTCERLFDCLSALEAWSSENPGHHPLFVQIEPKDGVPTADPEETFARLEAALLDVWPRARILAPDDVRGTAPTLREAITQSGWPKLGQTRGKVLFFIDDSSGFRDAYTRGGQNLDGRLMFVDSEPDAPYAATFVLNDPIGDASAIEAAVKAGFIVRTRADSDVVEPAAGDTTRREAALASGAQIVSTDFPVKVEAFDYFVEIPDGTPSRCNPQTAPSECTSSAIEDPRRLR